MLRYFIHLLNIAYLLIALIGVPAATSVHFGALRITSRTAAEFVILCALGSEFIINLTGYLLLKFYSRQKEFATCRNWAICVAILFAIHWALYQGMFDFDWLRDFLLWLKARVNI